MNVCMFLWTFSSNTRQAWKTCGGGGGGGGKGVCAAPKCAVLISAVSVINRACIDFGHK